MDNGTFTPGVNKDKVEPDYPYVAMRIPKGRAVIGSNSGGDRQEGTRTGEVCYVQVNPIDTQAVVSHLAYLYNTRKFGYVSHNFYGLLEPKKEAQLKNLISGWRDLAFAEESQKTVAKKGPKA